MKAAAGRRRWLVRILLGGMLAAMGFLAADLLSDRAQAPAVVALSPEHGLAAAAPAPPRLSTEPTEPTGSQDRGEPAPGLAPAPVLHPRDEAEWQGMRVNTAAQALCDTSSRCGLGMACHEGKCGPCASDTECAAGEACVLDHCLPAAQVQCHSRRDCSGDESLCVLTGYSPDPRGNAAMAARCQSAQGGTAAVAVSPAAGVPAPAPAAAPGTAAPPTAGDPQALLEGVRAHARATL